MSRCGSGINIAAACVFVLPTSIAPCACPAGQRRAFFPLQPQSAPSPTTTSTGFVWPCSFAINSYPGCSNLAVLGLISPCDKVGCLPGLVSSERCVPATTSILFIEFGKACCVSSEATTDGLNSFYIPIFRGGRSNQFPCLPATSPVSIPLRHYDPATTFPNIPQRFCHPKKCTQVAYSTITYMKSWGTRLE